MTDTQDDNVCHWPRCSRPRALAWLGHPVCNHHWGEICNRRDTQTSGQILSDVFGDDHILKIEQARQTGSSLPETPGATCPAQAAE